MRPRITQCPKCWATGPCVHDEPPRRPERYSIAEVFWALGTAVSAAFALWMFATIPKLSHNDRAALLAGLLLICLVAGVGLPTNSRAMNLLATGLGIVAFAALVLILLGGGK